MSPADEQRQPSGGDRDGQVQRLPVAFAVALRLHEAGVDEAMIATALAIEAESVGPLLAIANAKLARIERGTPGERGTGLRHDHSHKRAGYRPYPAGDTRSYPPPG